MIYWELVILFPVISATRTDPRVSAYDQGDSDVLYNFPPGDARLCQLQAKAAKFSVKRFEVLPGIGWDNLRNVEAGKIVTFNFSECKVTDDGRLLIPDNVFTIPLKSSSVESFAELIDSWYNTTSTTSSSINVDASMLFGKVTVSGSFSYEHTTIKSKQIEDKAVTTRVQLRYQRYEAKLQPDPVLDIHFKSRLLRIAALLELNNTDQAYYEGQLLVRDFGTHVVTSVTAGAVLVKSDFIKKDMVATHSEDKSAILAKASADFFNTFGIGAQYKHTTDERVDTLYTKSMTHSFVTTHGGPLYGPNTSDVQHWVNNLDINLVPVDRSGDPLYFLVTAQMLPELPVTTVSALEKVVRESIELYYEMNTIRGCTKLGSPNFSYSANFDDGSCEKKFTNMTFGGVFQTCEVSGQYLTHNPCTGLDQVNPKTGSHTCPPSYTAVLLHTGKRASPTETEKTCHSCWLVFHCCNEHQYKAVAEYSSYWCAATGVVPQDSGYLFGGFFTTNRENPVTGTHSCPPAFYSRLMFTDLNLCISDDFELGAGLSLPFGGFFSCQSGNPLSQQGVHPVGRGLSSDVPKKGSLRAFMASNGGDIWPRRCPEGYSQHLVEVDQGCSINYCVPTGLLSSPNLPKIKRPPFSAIPPALLTSDETTFMFDVNTQTWLKDEAAVQYQRSLSPSSPSRQSSSNDGLSVNATAGISVGVTLACVAVVISVVLLIKQRRDKRRMDYRSLSGETNYRSASTQNTSLLDGNPHA